MPEKPDATPEHEQPSDAIVEKSAEIDSISEARRFVARALRDQFGSRASNPKVANMIEGMLLRIQRRKMEGSKDVEPVDGLEAAVDRAGISDLVKDANLDGLLMQLDGRGVGDESLLKELTGADLAAREKREAEEKKRREQDKLIAQLRRGPKSTVPAAKPNDRCPCGSGKKYRNCHGAQK